jgi:hypothetical protein
MSQSIDEAFVKRLRLFGIPRAQPCRFYLPIHHYHMFPDLSSDGEIFWFARDEAYDGRGVVDHVRLLRCTKNI